MSRMPASLQTSTKPISIVILDDDKALLDSLTYCVSEIGYKIVPFDENDMLFEFFERHNTADVLILDIVGDPSQNGLNVLEELEEKYGENIPRILISSGLPYKNYSGHPALKKAPFVHFLQKPYNIEQFVNAIDILTLQKKSHKRSFY